MRLHTACTDTEIMALLSGYHVTILVDAISSPEVVTEDVVTALICQPQAVHQVSTVSEWAGGLFHY